MAELVSIAELISIIRSGIEPPLLAIDGLPCAGKSTLVERVAQHVDLDCIEVDDFVRPEEDWPSPPRPAFPFEFSRHAEFLETVRTLAATGACSYRPFDWDTLSVSPIARTVTLEKLVVIEGVSVLEPSLCPPYGLRVFVESDRASVLAAAIGRGDGKWETHWRELFLPSTDLYMATRPQDRADLLVAGREHDG